MPNRSLSEAEPQDWGAASAPRRSSSRSITLTKSSSGRAPVIAIPFTKKAGVPVTPAARPAARSVSTRALVRSA